MGTATRPRDGLASRRAFRRFLSPVNGRELFAALGALPGVRSARADTRGIELSRVLADLEVALLAPDADEQALRRTWKARANGGEMPLLLLSDASGGEGALHALGPLGAGGPVRLIGAEASSGSSSSCPHARR